MPVYKTYVCENCEKEVTKANTRGRFCSIKCQKDHDYKEYIEKWLSGEIDATTGIRVPKPSKHVYRWFSENFHECSECGISEWRGKPLTLEIDHKDGDRKNSRRENLRLPCPNCHSQTPTFRNKKRN